MAKLTPIPKNNSTKATVWHKRFFTPLIILSLKCDLYHFFTYGKIGLVSFSLTPWQNVMEKLTPFPQNNKILKGHSLAEKIFPQLS